MWPPRHRAFSCWQQLFPKGLMGTIIEPKFACLVCRTLRQKGETMLYKKILVPFDGSDPAKNALEVAKKLIADDPSATLHVLSVVPANVVAAELESPSNPAAGTPLMFADADAYERVIANAKRRAEEELREGVGDALDGVAFDVQVGVVISGKTADGIVDYAGQHGVDIIVMGRRGLGALRGMLGSVSYAVLHEADIPVLTVK